MQYLALDKYRSLQSFNETIGLLRSFFLSKNFVEVETQSRLSIMAACEDPNNITTCQISNTLWPLPQTGQMWLENDILRNPNVAGVFCVTTSYRDEKNPNTYRHLRTFPMFEFETHGGFEQLQQLLKELCSFLGFGNLNKFYSENYESITERYNTSIIEAQHEQKLFEEYGPVCFITNFPKRSHPFWNMKKSNDYACKIDTILYGFETIGSAERSCDVAQMRESFHTVSNGSYAKKLFDTFGKERVEKELEEYLSLDFFPRFGGGIGVDRLIRARTLHNEKAQVISNKTKELFL
jgi:aspartyl/asparaginyl-tRNA synthetase